MSKIGRKPVAFGNTKVEIKDGEVHYKGAKNSGVYVLPDRLVATVEGDSLLIKPSDSALKDRDINRIWGLHRALIANKIKGADTGFERQLKINGLGYKASVSGKKVVLSLGFSHKIDMDLPDNVTLEVDKSGQLLTFKSFDKELVGHICSKIRALRPPEPYKGTGIKWVKEVIRRKAGKAKAAA
ncbi:50S ribosomal protein L6 [Candidatus Dependentiae bacterium]